MNTKIENEIAFQSLAVNAKVRSMKTDVADLRLLLLIPLDWAQASCVLPHCGSFIEDYESVFSNKTQIQEHPWIGSVGYETSGIIIYTCLAVLISSQHMLAPAHCFEDWQLEVAPVHHVLLGDWNATSIYMQPDCDSQECWIAEIDEIITHPEYDNSSMANNISILKLAEAVTFTWNISPICLPPRNVNHIGQYLQYTGFALHHTFGYKMKALVHIVGVKKCRQTLSEYNKQRAALPLNHICGISNMHPSLATGSALMGVQEKLPKRKSYYLVGLLLAESKDMIQIYTMVQPYLTWIDRNLMCINMLR